MPALLLFKKHTFKKAKAEAVVRLLVGTTFFYWSILVEHEFVI